MGLLRTLLLGDIGNLIDTQENQKRIDALRSSQRKTVRNLHTRDQEISRLKRELQEQRFATQALTHFLVTKGVIAEGELSEFVEELESKQKAENKKKPFNIEVLDTRGA